MKKKRQEFEKTAAVEFQHKVDLQDTDICGFHEGDVEVWVLMVAGKDSNVVVLILEESTVIWL